MDQSLKFETVAEYELYASIARLSPEEDAVTRRLLGYKHRVGLVINMSSNRQIMVRADAHQKLVAVMSRLTIAPEQSSDAVESSLSKAS
jgi:hypothetical protein